MKKVFVIILLVLLSFSLAACRKDKTTTTVNNQTTTIANNQTTTKNLKDDLVPVTNLDASYQGVYMLNGKGLEADSSSIVFDGVNYKLYRLENKLVVLVGLKQEIKEVKFNASNVVFADFGTFTKARASVQPADVQGVYTFFLLHNKDVVLRDTTITIDGEKYYLLLNDSNETYFVKDGQNVSVTVNTEGESPILIVGTEPYEFKSDELPADLDKSELVSIIREIMNTINSTESAPNLSHKLTFSAGITAKDTWSSDSTKYSVTKPDPKNFLSSLYGFTLNGEFTARLKDFTIANMNNALGEFKGGLSYTMGGNTTNLNLQANLQDGKLYLKKDDGFEDTAEFMVKDLPSFGNTDNGSSLMESIDQVFLGGDMLDGMEEMMETAAEVEQDVKESGISLDVFESLFDDIVTITDEKVQINVNSTKLNALLAKIKGLVETTVKPALSNVYETLKDEELSEYENYQDFETKTLKEINDKLNEAEEELKNLTITNFNIEINLKTYEGNFNIDLTLAQEKYEKAQTEGAEDTLVLKYTENFKLDVSFVKIQETTIAKVNPSDYVNDYASIKGLISKYLPGINLPDFDYQDELKIEKRVTKGESGYGSQQVNEDKIEISVSISGIKPGDEAGLLAAFATYYNLTNDYSSYFGYTKVTKDMVTEIYVNISEHYAGHDETPYVHIIGEDEYESEYEDDEDDITGEYEDEYEDDYEEESDVDYVTCYINIEQYPNNLDTMTANIASGITVTFDTKVGNDIYITEDGVVSGSAIWSDPTKMLIIKDGNLVVGMAYLPTDYDEETDEATPTGEAAQVYFHAKKNRTYTFELVDLSDDYLGVTYVDFDFETDTTYYGPAYAKAGDTLTIEVSTVDEDGNPTKTYAIVNGTVYTAEIGQNLIIRLPERFDEYTFSIQVFFISESDAKSSNYY